MGQCEYLLRRQAPHVGLHASHVRDRRVVFDLVDLGGRNGAGDRALNRPLDIARGKVGRQALIVKL